jgi:hypothetical protein
MTDVRMLEEKAKPMKQIPELANGLNLPNHMAEHIYMFSGKSITVKLKTIADMHTQLTDWFGLVIVSREGYPKKYERQCVKGWK